VAAIVEAGVVPLLVARLNGGSAAAEPGGTPLNPAADQGRNLAAWALGRLAADNAAARAAIVEAGLVPLLVTRLSGSLNQGREHAAVALKHLAARNHTIRAIITEAGAIPPLVEMLSSGGWYTSRPAAAEVLGFLTEGNHDIAAAVVEAGAILPLVALLEYPGGESAPRPLPDSVRRGREAARALYNLTLHDAGRRQAEGLGYTRTRLRELQAKGSSSGHKMGGLSDW
jgi:hypothetical protein